MTKFFHCIGVVARHLPSVMLDGAGLLGAGMMAYGAHMIYEPAGYIVGGALLLLGAWLGNRRTA